MILFLWHMAWLHKIFSKSLNFSEISREAVGRCVFASQSLIPSSNTYVCNLYKKAAIKLYDTECVFVVILLFYSGVDWYYTEGEIFSHIVICRV